MLEQPLPAQDDAALENFIHPLPICADESCHTRSNLKALKGRYEMVNIKLDKTGGLTEALALATEARAQGFRLMLGCMLCTSRAISAALPLVPQVSFADLDGPTAGGRCGTGASVHDGRIASLGCQRSKFAIAKRYFSLASSEEMGGNSAVMQCKLRSAHQLPKEPGVS